MCECVCVCVSVLCQCVRGKPNNKNIGAKVRGHARVVPLIRNTNQGICENFDCSGPCTKLCTHAYVRLSVASP